MGQEKSMRSYCIYMHYKVPDLVLTILKWHLCIQGHEGRVTDMTFNPAGKWLITSSMDSTVRTWDLLTGSLIDKLTVDQVQLPYSRITCCSTTEFWFFSIDKTCVSTAQLGEGWLVQALGATPAQTKTDKDILWNKKFGFKIIPLYTFWSVNRYPQYNCIIRHQLTANFPLTSIK